MLERLGNDEGNDVFDPIPLAHDQAELALDRTRLHGRNDVVELGPRRNFTLADRSLGRPNGSVIFEEHGRDD